uniref:Uncharacterized protein n=1 Tax=Knipowitschia caucasica TaxID=637954 RepID=A0AAV2LTL8_KNICA
MTILRVQQVRTASERQRDPSTAPAASAHPEGNGHVSHKGSLIRDFPSVFAAEDRWKLIFLIRSSSETDLVLCGLFFFFFFGAWSGKLG